MKYDIKNLLFAFSPPCNLLFEGVHGEGVRENAYIIYDIILMMMGYH